MPYGEVFVLGQNNRARSFGPLPDSVIRRIAHAKIMDMLGSMPSLDQPACQCWRELSINEKAHQATDNTE